MELTKKLKNQKLKINNYILLFLTFRLVTICYIKTFLFLTFFFFILIITNLNAALCLLKFCLHCSLFAILFSQQWYPGKQLTTVAIPTLDVI
jgi:hypothetical protein